MQANVTLMLENQGTDSTCIEHINLKTNFEPTPLMTCQPDQLTWIANDYDEEYDVKLMTYTPILSTQCKAIEGISQLSIVVPDSDHAGSSSPIKMRFDLNNGKTCLTDEFDKKGRDFQKNSDSIYRSKNLGDCFHLDIQREDLKIENNVDQYIDIEVKADCLVSRGSTSFYS